MIEKKIQRSNDLVIQFTDDELSALNIVPGDKFSLKVEDNSILLQKYATIDLDMSEWSREMLEFLIAESAQKDISINEVISNILDSYLSKNL